MTRKELIRERYLLKKYLERTDYIAIKFAEGELNEEDYTPIKQERREARLRIREIETRLEEASK